MPDLMRELNTHRGTTFIFSTHDPKVWERASRIVHIGDGKLESDERRTPTAAGQAVAQREAR